MAYRARGFRGLTKTGLRPPEPPVPAPLTKAQMAKAEKDSKAALKARKEFDDKRRLLHPLEVELVDAIGVRKYDEERVAMHEATVVSHEGIIAKTDELLKAQKADLAAAKKEVTSSKSALTKAKSAVTKAKKAVTDAGGDVSWMDK